MKLKDLKEDLAYKWKPQECKQYGATMVAYIDSRDVQDLLDKVCGQEGWQDRYLDVKGRVYCEIGIKCGEEWIWKGDCGTESNFEKEKGESSDAFKRAAVKWGVGRFLYSLGIVKLKTAEYKSKYYPAVNGKIVWDKAELNDLCNKLVGKKPVEPEQNPKHQDDEPDFVKNDPPEPKDKPSITKKFKALPQMSGIEKAIMTNVIMKCGDLKPIDLNKRDFNKQIAIETIAKLSKYPDNDEEEQVTIELIQKMYGKVGG